MRAREERLALGPRPLYPLKAAATRARSLLWLLRTRGRIAEDGMRILFYHRVSRDADELAVSPQRFREQMDLLAQAGFEVVDAVEAASRLFSTESIPQRLLGLSFDDGYLDVAKEALPMLEQHGFRATVFVATSLIDGTTPLSWYEGRPPPLLGWSDIMELDRLGTLRFGAHSVTHRNLVSLDDEEARAEIVESKRVLEGHLGREVEAFSYPGGLMGERERAFVEEAGYRIAVSCEPGANYVATDRLALRRRQIDARDSKLDFRAKLGGGHDSSLPGRALYRRLRYGAAAMPRRASSVAYRSR
jgi:peptidoglycan/xylan/chitin deacetylase (PgdA/CDA1 family)